MYCQNCGNEINPKLKYCSGCGMQIRGDEDKDGTPGKMLDNILTTLFLVVMFGLGILVGLVAVLMSNGVDPDLVVKLSVIYLAAVFGICFLLLRQVPKLVDAKLNKRREPALPQPEFVPPQRLRQAATAQLEEYQQPAVSITEHTTRTLEEVPLKRN